MSEFELDGVRYWAYERVSSNYDDNNEQYLTLVCSVVPVDGPDVSLDHTTNPYYRRNLFTIKGDGGADPYSPMDTHYRAAYGSPA